MKKILRAILAALLPPTGKRRETVPPSVTARPQQPHPASRVAPPLMIDGEAIDIVRPYVVCAERRRALELALDGIDVGPEIIHGWRVVA